MWVIVIVIGVIKNFPASATHLQPLSNCCCSRSQRVPETQKHIRTWTLNQIESNSDSTLTAAVLRPTIYNLQGINTLKKSRWQLTVDLCCQEIKSPLSHLSHHSHERQLNYRSWKVNPQHDFNHAQHNTRCNMMWYVTRPGLQECTLLQRSWYHFGGHQC